MERRAALALAIVAVEEMAEIDPDPDWAAARQVLAEMLRAERRRAEDRPWVHSKTLQHWQAIEREFREPVGEVIQGMRDQGATWRTIAGALEVTTYTLYFWRQKLGMLVDGRSRQWDALSRENFQLNGGGGYGRWNGKHKE
jgi:hypothetical protein